MPDDFRRDDVVAAYRAYYAGAKRHFASKGEAVWTGRARPDFMAQA